MSVSGLLYGKVASYFLPLTLLFVLDTCLHTEKPTCIFTGFKPCLKIFITVGCGFGLSKRGLMPQAGSKAMSQVAINISLPCLLFSNIVPAFTSDNVKNLGPLFMMAFGYQIIGGTLALIVRELFYVPKDFQYGILVLGIMSNWGNISTAIVSSVTQDRPFNPATDLQLGIAYIAVFIISNNIIMYGAGLFRVIALDLRDDRPEVPRTLASRLSHRRQQLQSLKHRITNRRHRITETEPASPKTSAISLRKVQDPESAPATTTAEPTGDILAERPFDGSFRSRQNNSEPEILPVLSRSASISTIDAKVEDNPPTGISPALDPTSHPHESVRSVVVKRIKAFASPPTVAVIVSLLVALVPPLKALMVPVEGWSGSKISNAPDGGAPLAFLYDSAEFIGQIMMPASLIILGAAFARLKLSRRRLKEMPLPAIAAMTVAKLCIMPTIGILSTRSLSRHTTLFPPDQKMLSFIPYLLSGTPSSNSQIALTTLVLRDGQTVDIVAAFMLAQYAVLILQNSALTAISLYLVS